MRALTLLVLHHELRPRSKPFVALKLVVDILPLADGRLALLVDRGQVAAPLVDRSPALACRSQRYMTSWPALSRDRKRLPRLSLT